MHELSMVESIYEIIMEKVREYGINRVLQVRLVVGQLTGIEDGCIESCFAMYVEKTPIEGAELVIKRMPVKLKCRACGNEYETKIPFSPCPVCGNNSIRILSGRELYLDSLEAE